MLYISIIIFVICFFWGYHRPILEFMYVYIYVRKVGVNSGYHKFRLKRPNFGTVFNNNILKKSHFLPFFDQKKMPDCTEKSIFIKFYCVFSIYIYDQIAVPLQIYIYTEFWDELSFLYFQFENPKLSWNFWSLNVT